MMRAPFILCAFWCASSPTHGAMLVAPGHPALRVSAGMDWELPTLSASVLAGVVDGADVELAYDAHAVIFHVASVTGRVRVTSRAALGLRVARAFSLIQDVAGVQANSLPTGNGLYLQPLAWYSWFTESAMHLSVELGATVRVEGPSERIGVVRHPADDPALVDAQLGITAEWAGDGGATFVRARASVPVEQDFRIIGFFPWVQIGRTWMSP